MTEQRIRPPSGLNPPAPAGSTAGAQLLSDRGTLHEIVAGLDRLEQLLDQTPVLGAAERRGYFTPDDDDCVRQSLLAYRNYRALVRADRFWRGSRRTEHARLLDADTDWHWLLEIIRRKRMRVHKRLFDVFRRRLR